MRNRIHTIGLAVLPLLAAWGLTAGCGDGKRISVELDPDAWLLREGLPAPASEGQALRLKGAWGRYLWTHDVLPGCGFGGDVVAMDGPVPPALNRTEVALSIDPDARTIAGTAEIDLFADESGIGSLRFRLSAADVDEVVASNPGAAFSYDGQILTVTPDMPLFEGAPWSLTIRWHDSDVEVTTDSFPEWGGEDILVGYVGSPSTFFTFGYWFWPQVIGEVTAAPVEFSVTYPEDLQLVMSGEHLGTEDGEDGTRTDTWQVSEELRWHITMALGPYEKVTGSCGSSTMEIYGLDAESDYPIVPASYVPVLDSICENYQRRFGEPAFDTIRLAGVDERFTNGYSSPSLIIVPNYTLDDDGSGSFPARDFYIAHEVSHQWWGNDVFMDAMRDAWLTEGMADYSAITYLEEGWGPEEARNAWLTDAKALFDYYAQGGRDHPLVPTDDSDMEPHVYYLKGAWVLRMLEWVIGEDAMAQAIRSYREAHHFEPATTQDFISEAETASGQDLSWFFNQWLYGTGVMSLSESHKTSGDDVELTITQNNTWSDDPPQYFQMPLQVRIEKGGKATEEIVHLDGAENSFTLPRP